MRQSQQKSSAFSSEASMANSVDPEQTDPKGAVCFGSKLFASILNSSVMLGSYLQQTASADDIFRCIFTWRFKGICFYQTTIRVSNKLSGSRPGANFINRVRTIYLKLCVRCFLRSAYVSFIKTS